RYVHAGERVGENPAPVPAHTHERVELCPERGDVVGLASDDPRREHVLYDRDDRLGRDDAVGLAPAHHAVRGRDFHQHRSIEHRIDRPVAGADEIAALVDALARAERTEVRHLARQRDDNGLDRADRPRHLKCQFASAPCVMPLTRNGSSSRKRTNTGTSERVPTAMRLGQSTRYSPRNDCIPTVSIQRSGSLTSVRAKTKSDQVTIARYVAHAARPGRASGSTTYQTACAPLQPSSIAASSISRGMQSTKPFISQVANGTPTAALARISPSR